MVSTPLKKISQNGNLPQVGVTINNIWNHHLVCKTFPLGISNPSPVDRRLRPWRMRSSHWELRRIWCPGTWTNILGTCHGIMMVNLLETWRWVDFVVILGVWSQCLSAKIRGHLEVIWFCSGCDGNVTDTWIRWVSILDQRKRTVTIVVWNFSVFQNKIGLIIHNVNPVAALVLYTHVWWTQDVFPLRHKMAQLWNPMTTSLQYSGRM